jgi:hypothetical protein
VNNPLESKEMMGVSVSLDFPCTVHAFFPERLSNRCQGLCHTFSELCTEFDSHSSSNLSRNRIGPGTRLQIKDVKIPMSTQLHEIMYTDSQEILVLSSIVASRYNYCTDDSARPGNYGYALVHTIFIALEIKIICTHKLCEQSCETDLIFWLR